MKLTLFTIKLMLIHYFFDAFTYFSYNEQNDSSAGRLLFDLLAAWSLPATNASKLLRNTPLLSCGSKVSSLCLLVTNPLSTAMSSNRFITFLALDNCTLLFSSWSSSEVMVWYALMLRALSPWYHNPHSSMVFIPFISKLLGRVIWLRELNETDEALVPPDTLLVVRALIVEHAAVTISANLLILSLILFISALLQLLLADNIPCCCIIVNCSLMQLTSSLISLTSC